MATAPPYDDDRVSANDFFKQRRYMYITRSPGSFPTIEEIANELNITVGRAKELQEELQKEEQRTRQRESDVKSSLGVGGRKRRGSKSKRRGSKSKRRGCRR